MCPDFRATNPYQELLAASLAEHNINVSWGREFGRFAIYKAIKYHPCLDLIHLHWSSPFWLDSHPIKSRLAALRFLTEIAWAKMQGVKLVWTIHNIQDHEWTNPILERNVNRKICRLVDHIIVHCEASEAAVLHDYRLSERFRQKISIVGHGNLIDFYENRMTQSTARQQLQIPSDHLVLLYFGRIRPYKGVPELIKAFHQLDASQIHLIIAGQVTSADAELALQNECRDHPHIHLYPRFVPDTVVQRFMNAADVVVLPFLDIVASSTVILGMSFGKAIVTPMLGCLSETLDVRGCVFYDPHDKQGLVAALRQISSSNWQRMGSWNLELAKMMNWSSIGRMTAEIYSGCFK